MTLYADARHVLLRGDAGYIIAGYLCDGCHAPSVAMLEMEKRAISHLNTVQLGQVISTATPVWLPPKAVGKEFPDVPDHIAAAAKEAYECADVSAWRGAVLVARSVIEATAKSNGITSGSLMDKIDAMRDAGLIREHIKEGAHEVRHLGNDMAHGDLVEPVSLEEGELVLTLMGEVLLEVFQSPARVARARAAREGKSSESSG